MLERAEVTHAAQKLGKMHNQLRVLSHTLSDSQLGNQIIRLLDIKTDKVPHCHRVSRSNCQTARLLNCRTVRLSD